MYIYVHAIYFLEWYCKTNKNKHLNELFAHSFNIFDTKIKSIYFLTNSSDDYKYSSIITLKIFRCKEDLDRCVFALYEVLMTKYG